MLRSGKTLVTSFRCLRSLADCVRDAETDVIVAKHFLVIPGPLPPVVGGFPQGSQPPIHTFLPNCSRKALPATPPGELLSRCLLWREARLLKRSRLLRWFHSKSIQQTHPRRHQRLAASTALLLSEISAAAQLQPGSDLEEQLRIRLRPLAGSFHMMSFSRLIEGGAFPQNILGPFIRWVASETRWDYDGKRYTNLIGVLGKRGEREGLKALMEVAVNRGGAMDIIVFAAAMQELNRLGEYPETVRLFCTAEERQILDGSNPYPFTYVLVALRKLRDLKTARKVLQNMKARGDAPSVIMYNVLLDICGLVRNQELLEATVVEMVEAGLQPTAVTYTTLIHAYTLLGDAQSALKVVEEMNGRGIVPTAKMYGAVLQMLVSMDLQGKAKQVLREIEGRQDLPRDAEYYRLLVKGYSHPLDVGKLLEVHGRMLEAGVTLDVAGYVDMFAKLKDSGLQEVSWKLFEDIQAVGSLPANATVYGLVSRGLEEGGQAAEADQVWQVASETSLPKGVLSLFQRIESLVAARDYISLRECVVEGKGASGRLPGFAYNMLLSELRDCQTEEEEGVLAALAESGHKSHQLVELLLDVNESEAAMWQRAEPILRGLWGDWDESPWQFVRGLIGLLHSRGLTERATTVWEFAKKLRLNLPQVFQLRQVRGLWKIDVHRCCLSCAKVIICRELKYIRGMPASERQKWLDVIPGQGLHSKVVGESVLNDGVRMLLGELRSPFRPPRENKGCFVAKIAQVQRWLSDPRVWEALGRCGEPMRAPRYICTKGKHHTLVPQGTTIGI